MALINCTECDKEISDKASACINCGCPIESMVIIPAKTSIDIQDIIDEYKKKNGLPIQCNWQIEDDEELFDTHMEVIEDIIWENFNVEEISLASIVQHALENKDFNYTLDKRNKMATKPSALAESEQIKITPKCPTCSSTNIQKIGLASKGVAAAAFGVLSVGYAGKTFECGGCGYKW